MGAIFQLTLADNLRSLRFQLSLVILLLFFIGNGLVYTWKGERVAIENEQALCLGSQEDAMTGVAMLSGQGKVHPPWSRSRKSVIPEQA